MQIGILGPLQASTGAGPIGIAGTRLRALLTRLAVAVPAPVPTAELLDAVWPDGPPADPVNALQSLVSRLRRAIGDAAEVQPVPGGYRLAVAAGDVDATVFGDLVASGRRALQQGRPDRARDELSRALALWRGEPLADAADGPYAAGSRARLVELRLDAQIDLIEARLQLGSAADVVADLEQLVAAHPLRERLAGQLMRALALTGRQADALAVHERLRDRLVGELGVDPGAEEQAVYLAVLRGEIAATTGPGPAPPRSHPRRTNLRAPLPRLIGRDEQVRRIRDLLADGRLVTVVGPGGAGKTRLAQEVGALLADDRPDGVYLVELAPVTEAAGIVPAVIGALGLVDPRAVERRSDRTVRDSPDHLVDVLAGADCLLVVDNCEHLITPVADLVDGLLARSPGLRVLATSREPLGIVGEALCVVPPLGLPPVGVTAAEATRYPSVRLLVERGRAVASGFEVSAATVAQVVEIVRRLDGLPLAIELAAARLRVMPIGEIAARLSDRFRLLTGGSRTAMPRHRTLRAVVEWSWGLLDADERLLAERLAVFPAGATVAAATAVCADDRLPAGAVGDLVLALVDKSLLTVVDGPAARYRMLETIREYGVERLAERGEVSAARLAHARYFVDLAHRTDPLLRTADQLDAIATLTAERDNIAAALRVLAESGDPADRTAGLELAMAMTWFWQMTGAEAEASGAMRTALAACTDHPQRPWAVAMVSLFGAFVDPNGEQSGAGVRVLSRRLARSLLAGPPPPNSGFAMLPTVLALFGNDRETAAAALRAPWVQDDEWTRAAVAMGHALFAENEGRIDDHRDEIDRALAGFERIGDRWGQSSVLASRGNLRGMDGDVSGGLADYERALALAEELGSTDDQAMVRVRMAGLLMRAGDLARASALIDQVRALQPHRTPGFDRDLFVAGLRAMIRLLAGDLPGAAELAAELRTTRGYQGSEVVEGHALAVVCATAAVIAVHVGDADQAAADLRVGYPVARRTEDMPVIATVGVAVAWLAAAVGRPAAAATALGAAARLRGSDDALDPVVARLTARLRAELGSDFAKHYRAGTALSRADAIDALDPARAVPDGVTPDGTVPDGVVDGSADAGRAGAGRADADRTVGAPIGPV
ncbi:BTAD domain-containing putative transcriptional regulator [Nakamurella sp.]|uniref:BTAD domain-containing putative transcriptional regulator n=1 Tax=Nakamurella sp. TaxID=1869182 RepID=UPI003B3A2CD9